MLRRVTSRPHIPLDALELTGRARTHLVELDDPRCALHAAAAGPFLAMRAAAAREGLLLEPASAFRDFERQCLIWNAKYRGERPLLDRAGRALEAAALTPAERVEAILCWSALPGASRHHWGSDLDVYDRAALPEGARPALLPAEYAPGGPFARLDAWLAAHAHEYGFYRPYMSDRGGVGFEPWHISYAPVADDCVARLDAGVLRDALGSAELEGAAEVRERLGELLVRHVAAVDPAPQAALDA
ncbi:MAG: D-alanyl-D-alanine carboxypeptidase family protein [Gammaproteobacteria bacterium]|nr:D-alanyl-D-alanine carboxypeptidase family protein [Gammaproteobacteria bacterium]